jgi:WD repeat-containing protein 89
VTSPEDTALLSFDISSNGYLVAAGTESNADGAEILYWDVRKPLLTTHSHTSTHSDDITVMQFNPSTNALLSASSDGLLSLSDPLEQDEDEAVLNVGNWGTSIAQAGWYEDSIWAASDMETFSLWTADLDKSADFNLRDLHQRLPQNQVPWQPDYLIGCRPSADDLLLFVGSNL